MRTFTVRQLGELFGRQLREDGLLVNWFGLGFSFRCEAGSSYALSPTPMAAGGP